MGRNVIGGEMLRGEMLWGKMLRGEMLWGEVLWGEMLGHIIQDSLLKTQIKITDTMQIKTFRRDWRHSDMLGHSEVWSTADPCTRL